MKRATLSTFLLLLMLNVAPLAHGATHAGAKIYLAPQGGFETYLAAAFTKKHVPATIVGDPEQADYVLESAPVEHKTESTGGKVARCLFLNCVGIEGVESTSVRLIDQKNGHVLSRMKLDAVHSSLAPAKDPDGNPAFLSLVTVDSASGKTVIRRYSYKPRG